MEKFYIKTRKFDKIAVLVFTLLFMTVGFLQLCSLTFGNKIISVVQWPTVALGMVILLERFISFKYYKKTAGIILLILFAIGFLISSLITFSYGWYENLRFLIFTVFQFGLLYATDLNENPEDVKKRTAVAANYFLIISAIMSVASFVVMLAGYKKAFAGAVQNALPSYFIGFWFGRLYGVYWDPNIGAITASVAIILSGYFLINTKKPLLKALNISNIVLQFFYIVFSGSRTGSVSITAGSIMLVVLFCVKRKLFENKIKNIIAIVLVAAITFCITYFGPAAIKSTVNNIVNFTNSSQNSGTVDTPGVDDPGTDTEPDEDPDTETPEEDIFDRGYDLSTDISNQRFAIWKSALEIFSESPIFGVSRANIRAFAEKNLPKTYIINNYHMKFDSMHNTYVEVLTSCGIVGIILFMSFMIYVIVRIIRNFKEIFASEKFYLIASIIGICTVLSVCSLFIAEMLFVISPASTVLWVSLGYMNYYISKIENGSERNENA